MSRSLLLLVFVGSGFGGFVGALLFYVARTAALRLAFWRMGRELRSNLAGVERMGVGAGVVRPAPTLKEMLDKDGPLLRCNIYRGRARCTLPSGHGVDHTFEPCPEPGCLREDDHGGPHGATP